MILCCGEALIDMLPRDLQGTTAYAPHAGGAVFNTAIALGRLDMAPGFLCGLSQDMFGELLVDTLAASKVDASLSPRLNNPCTLAFVKLVDGQATYAFYDENTALKAMTVDDLPAIPNTVQALFFGGISLAGEPCCAAYEHLMLDQALTRVTMIDPNIRPGFINDRAAYVNRINRMMAAADIVKLSDEDMHWLMGDGTLADHAQTLITAGTQVVLVTEGSKGVTAYTQSGAVQRSAQRVQVVDTVGAGDTFNAGFLAALQQQGLLSKASVAQLTDEQLSTALDLGNTVAAVTVSRAGANPPWAQEL